MSRSLFLVQLLLVAPLFASAIKPFKASKQNLKTIAGMKDKAVARAGNPDLKHPKCPPKLNRAAMLQRSIKARSLEKQQLPDPACHTGVLSLAGEGPDPQVCCPAYCGECSDYPTCENVKGQASKQRCCASEVAAISCEGSDEPVTTCIKSCTERVPPCIMPAGETFEMPSQSSAAEDCNNAIHDWMTEAKGAITGEEGGEAQWKKQMTYKLDVPTNHF